MNVLECALPINYHAQLGRFGGEECVLDRVGRRVNTYETAGRAAHCNKGSLFCVYFEYVYVRSKQIDNFDIKNAIEKCINVISAREFFLSVHASAFFFRVELKREKELK